MGSLTRNGDAGAMTTNSVEITPVKRQKKEIEKGKAMKKLTPNEKKYLKSLKRTLNREAAGYEYDLYLAFGYIEGLLASKAISRKFRNELVDNFATEPDGDWEDWMDKVEKKYGRVFA